MASMGAPEARSARVTARSSSSVIAPAGRQRSAEPPPETSARTKSPAPQPSASAISRAVASRPRASGTGCAASATSTPRSGRACPSRVTTRPSQAPQALSAASAMRAAALPAPSTTTRPSGRGGSAAGTQRIGSAASTAASKSALRKARGLSGPGMPSCPLIRAPSASGAGLRRARARRKPPRERDGRQEGARMPHVVVAGPIHAAGRALLEGAPGVTVTYADEGGEAGYAPHMAGADALMIRTQPLGAETIARAPRLRMVSRHGVGVDAVDVAALSARGIPLAVCGDANSSAVAEHAMMLMLAAAKRARMADAAVRAGDWRWRDRLLPVDLAGRTLLIVGFGRVGRQVARMAAGFGMRLAAFDPHRSAKGWPVEGPEGEVREVRDLREGMAAADVVSVSIPRGARPLIGADELAALRPGAILVNTARGGIVDEAALVRALEDGTVAAAGLDVFDTEPLPPAHPLTGFDQVILSPHVAGVTEGAAERMALSAARNVLDFFEGRLDPALVVNRAALGGG